MVESEYKEVTKTYWDNVFTKAVCDGCGKEENEMPEDWYTFTGDHYEWGNDSVDSIETYCCCSGGCYINAIKKAAEDFKNYGRSAKIDEKPLSFILEIIKKDG